MSNPVARHDPTAVSVLDSFGERRDPNSGLHASAAHELRLVAAPELVGADAAVATARARMHALHPVCHRLEVAADTRGGKVLAQIPTAGSTLDAGEPIALLIAATPEELSTRQASDSDAHGISDWPEPTDSTCERPSESDEHAADPNRPPEPAAPPRGAPILRRRPTRAGSRQRALIGLAALAGVMAGAVAVNPKRTSRSEQPHVARPADRPAVKSPPAVARPSLSRRPARPNSQKPEGAAHSARAPGSLRRAAAASQAARLRHAERTIEARARRRRGPRPPQDRVVAPASPPSPPASQPPRSPGASRHGPTPTELPPGPEFF